MIDDTSVSIGGYITYQSGSNKIFTARVSGFTGGDGYYVHGARSSENLIAHHHQLLRVNDKVIDKHLILRDISERLVVGAGVEVMFLTPTEGLYGERDLVKGIVEDKLILSRKAGTWDIMEFGIRPILRPLETITPDLYDSYLNTTSYMAESLEEEEIADSFRCSVISEIAALDWLRNYEFDYHGLIERYLAVENEEDSWNKFDFHGWVDFI